MAKTIQQAEAELRTAALAYAESWAEYVRAWEMNREGDRERDAGGNLTGELKPGTLEAVRRNSRTASELQDAARDLLKAINNEQRAEAL
jgi:hypothetical protein